MKKVQIPILVLASVIIALPSLTVYSFVQRAEAKRQQRLAEEAKELALQNEALARMQRNAAIAAQHEAESQRQLAEMHRIELDRALAACKGK